MTPSRKKTKKNSSNRRHVSVSIRDVAKRAGVSISTAGVVAVTTINGRAMALSGPVTMVNTVINAPAP